MADIGITLLVGQKNCQTWRRDFQAIAQYKGLWQYFDGQAGLRSWPEQKSHELGHHGGNFFNCLTCERWRTECNTHWKESEQAIGLLRLCLHPSIRHMIPEEEQEPEEALELIRDFFEMEPKYAHDIAETKLDAVHFVTCNTITAYMNRAQRHWNELNNAGCAYSHQHFTRKLFDDLPLEYRSILDKCLKDNGCCYLRNEEEIKDFVARVLVEEVMLKVANKVV